MRADTAIHLTAAIAIEAEDLVSRRVALGLELPINGAITTDTLLMLMTPTVNVIEREKIGVLDVAADTPVTTIGEQNVHF